jgi:hypothetical protein
VVLLAVVMFVGLMGWGLVALVLGKIAKRGYPANGVSGPTRRAGRSGWYVSHISDSGPNKVRSGMEGMNARMAQEVYR